jgi:hypothetical protein
MVRRRMCSLRGLAMGLGRHGAVRTGVVKCSTSASTRSGMV